MSAVHREWSSLCYVLWNLLCLLFCIIMLSIFSAEIDLITSLKTNTSKYSYNELIDFSDSLFNAYQLASLNPIIDLKLISVNASCPPDYELLDLMTWNSKTICSYPYMHNYTVGACSNNSESNKINQRYTIDAKRLTLSVWGSVQFCVQRTNQWYRTTSLNCNDGYQSCPKQVCIKGDQCPINNLFLADSFEQTQNLNTTQETYISIGNLSDSKELYASRNYQGDFLIHLVAETNGIPCILRNEGHNRTEFPLYMLASNNCSTYGSDPSIYSIVDMQDEIQYLVQNNIHYIYGGIDLNSSTTNDTTYLYSVVRTENSCPEGDFLIDSDASDIETFSSLRLGGNIFGIIYIIFCLIMLGVHFLYLFQKNLAHSPIFSTYLLIFIFIEFIICPISLNYLTKIQNNDKFLNSIISSDCFTNQEYNKLFDNYGQDILIDSKKDFGFIHTILYFGLVVFISLFFYIIDISRFQFFFDVDDVGYLEKEQWCKGCDNKDDKDDCCKDCDLDIDCDII